jgi:hypothetical protein
MVLVLSGLKTADFGQDIGYWSCKHYSCSLHKLCYAMTAERQAYLRIWSHHPINVESYPCPIYLRRGLTDPRFKAANT